MQCDERKQICLTYATNVPEWQMGLTLEALAALGEVSSTCGKVQKAVAGDLAWTKLHPDSEYLGTLAINRVKVCNEAASALGKALWALEVLLAQSEQFGFAFGLARGTESAYGTQHEVLEDRCRTHGCAEVAYNHG